jgi:hypothetical protein
MGEVKEKEQCIHVTMMMRIVTVVVMRRRRRIKVKDV